MQKSDLQHLIEAYWTAAAPHFTRIVRKDLAGEQKALWQEKILRNSPKQQGMDVLDLGTGPGFFAIILSEARNRVIGVDCTAQMLDAARANVEDAGVPVRLLKMDAHTLDFPDGSFDLVVSRNLSWTLYNPSQAYAEWKRVLRPGGRLLIFDAPRGRADPHGQGPSPRYPAPDAPEEYAGKMFLYGKLRPAWDITALSLLDMDVYTEADLGEALSPPWGLPFHSPAPLFLVAAEKRMDVKRTEKVLYRGTWKIRHIQIRWDNPSD